MFRLRTTNSLKNVSKFTKVVGKNNNSSNNNSSLLASACSTRRRCFSTRPVYLDAQATTPVDPRVLDGIFFSYCYYKFVWFIYIYFKKNKQN